MTDTALVVDRGGLMKTKEELRAQVADLNSQLIDCKTSSAGKDEHIADLEAEIDRLEALLPPEPAFQDAGAYGSDDSPTGYDVKKSVGIHTLNGPLLKARLDELQAAGMQSIAWMGSYDRVVPNDFERGDDWVKRQISAVAGHPALAAYQLTDEINGA